MLWVSWEEIRENLEKEIAKLGTYNAEDQVFVVGNKTVLELNLMDAMRRAINTTYSKGTVVDIGVSAV